MSPNVLSQCLFLKTSKEVWDKLNGLYDAQSSAMQIHMQLATLKKHDLSTTDYFNRIKMLTDTHLFATMRSLHICSLGSMKISTHW
jgi:hypothetical protein